MDNVISESIKKIYNTKKVYAVLLFYTELELGISNEPGKWVCTNVTYFDSGAEALDYYANTRCPASQLVDGINKKDLEFNIKQMKDHFKDQSWLDTFLYPYL